MVSGDGFLNLLGVETGLVKEDVKMPADTEVWKKMLELEKKEGGRMLV